MENYNLRELTEAYPSDPSMYSPTQEELEWLNKRISIQDEGELKKYALKIQAEGLVIRLSLPLPREIHFHFVDTPDNDKLNSDPLYSFKVGKHPAYKDALALGKDRPGSIYFEMGCCSGNDVRKVVSDGYPIENVIGSDPEEEFWKIGHNFFRTSTETFPVPFLAGDVFNPSFLS
ncbi:hypothetical protein M422DRAFT_269263 [Sphaerobolus stellatus SS14]|uniref:Uncharacterized protein n=1 Tax=Sphaerobolus stellatus (strain SS14) TaxID=990650 RepID=A0A0C9TIF3_SPHS4|nr:hypothetical protein M422DRAFT_269263 [Sphaerobolus stellatus SS14]